MSVAYETNRRSITHKEYC